MFYFLDILLSLILSLVFSSLLIMRILLLRIVARVTFKNKVDKERNFLRIYQGSFYEAKRKDVLGIFYDNNYFFDHEYIVGFPAEQSGVIQYDKNYTFIDINKRGEPLKKYNLKLSFTIINLFIFLWATISLWRLVKKEISLIRGYDPHHTGLASMLLSFITKVPYCISIHCDYDLIFPENSFFYMKELPIHIGPLRKKIERFIFSRTKYVLCISQYIASYALLNGARKNTIRIIPHGVDFSPFIKKTNTNEVRSWLECKNKYLIVVVSRISLEKNIMDISDIALNIQSEKPDFLFIIAGDGPAREELEESIHRLKLDEKIRLLGFQNQKTIANLRKAADVNLCLLDGYSLIEAALSARPVVAYDTEWHSELIRHNETGLLVPNRDTGAASLAIKRLIDNPDLSNLLGQNAKRLAIERYSSHVSLKKKIAVYKEVINSV